MKLKQSRTQSGLTLIEMMIVIVIISVLVAIYLPQLTRSRARVSRINCVNNLKQVCLSFRMWALDNGDKFPMQASVTNGGTVELVSSSNTFVHFLVMSNELNTPKILFCPEDKSRTAATSFTTNFSNKNLSYFAGVDANETSPQTFLSGDDNFTVGGARPKPGLLLLWTNTPVAWTSARHTNQGNIGLADGSVMVVSSPRWQQALVASGAATNRLAMP